MKRREFIAALAGTAIATSRARAQQTAKVPIIAFMGSDARTWQRWTDAFAQQLAALGWAERRTIAFAYRWDDGRSDRDAESAAELVRLNVDAIITAGSGPVLAAARVTSSIPIVFAIATDPVGSGLVASLAHPGSNVTGLSALGTDLVGKRLELLRQLLPGSTRLAVLAHVDERGPKLEMEQVLTVAARLGLTAIPVEIHSADQIEPAIRALKGRVDALYVCADRLVNANRRSISELAIEARLPTVFSGREDVEAGGLMAYGPNVTAMFRRAAEITDKILRGAKPADIPVEQPSRLDLGINLKTAKALGLTIPEALLATADEVIE